MLNLILYFCIVPFIFYTLQSLNIPIKIIKECRDRKEIPQLVDYIFMKTIFSNSCFYNFSYSKLSNQTGFSRSKVTKLVKFFKSKDWVRFHSGNLILALDKSIYKYFKEINFITKNDILNEINLFLFENKQRQCMYAYKCRKDRQNPSDISLREYKEALKYERKYSFKGAICDKFVISAESAGYVFNCSRSKANQILLTLERERKLIVERTKVLVKKCSLAMFEYYVPKKGAIGSYWWFNGGIYNSQPNSYVVSSLKLSRTDKFFLNKSR